MNADNKLDAAPYSLFPVAAAVHDESTSYTPYLCWAVRHEVAPVSPEEFDLAWRDARVAPEEQRRRGLPFFIEIRRRPMARRTVK